MKKTCLIPALLVALLSGCASTGGNDPVRQRVLADLEQARADGSYPLTEAQYIYPNWDKSTRTSAR